MISHSYSIRNPQSNARELYLPAKLLAVHSRVPIPPSLSTWKEGRRKMSGAGFFGYTQGASQYPGAAGTGAAAGYPGATAPNYAVTYAPTAAASAPYAFTAAANAYQAAYQPPPPPAPPTSAASYGAFTTGAASAPKPPFSAPNAAPGQPKPPPPNPASVSTYTGYDAAVYAAATSYLQSKAQGSSNQWLGLKKNPATQGPGTTAAAQPRPVSVSSGASRPYGQPAGSSFPRKTGGYGRGGIGGGGAGGGFRSQQIHYCDVCKISCAGPQTYREHLEGQKHKKKEQAAKGASTQPLAKTKASFRCDLCQVTCTGQDTYQAHIRGSKHQKTVKLHQTLGKPIPSSDPVIIPPAGGPGKPMVGTISTDASGKKVIGMPKMNFVGGKQLSSSGGTAVGAGVSEGVGVGSGKAESAVSAEAIEAALALEKDVQPVGEDYVEPMKDHTGKVIQFFCKLCDCKFNDLNAKDMHLKGRRHRLQFKKKVNPELEVEMKPLPGGRGVQRRNEEKLRKELMRLRQQELWSMRAMYASEPSLPPSLAGPLGPSPLFAAPPSAQPRRDSMDDRHISAKHDSIYPTEEELAAVQKIVTNVEKALKGVSDAFETAATATATQTATETAKATEGEAVEGGERERSLKGVMRVGLLAKGLLLRGDLGVSLVVLCSGKPTRALLRRVMEALPEQLSSCAGGENYDVTLELEQAGLVVAATSEPRASVNVVLTSVLMRAAETPESAASKTSPFQSASQPQSFRSSNPFRTQLRMESTGLNEN